MKRYILCATLMALAGCQSGDGSVEDGATAPSASIVADVTLRATSDVQTPSPIKAASFVPNSVATWLGHIILLDSKGTLHRATTDSSETAVVALGKYADVLGLKREKKAGVFLALTAQGQIKGFIQSDDEGNFAPLAVSQSNDEFERFCATSAPSSNVIWAKTTSKQTQKLTVEVFEDTSVSLTQADISADDIDPCAANNALSLNETYRLKPNRDGEGLILASETSNLSVGIANGLSIGAMRDVGIVTVTSANMGSVYNEGVILLADTSAGRIVLISRSYALKELAAR